MGTQENDVGKHGNSLIYMVNLLWYKFLIITFSSFFFLILPKLNVVCKYL